MDINEQKAIIEAMLFASGRTVKITEMMAILELPRKELELILQQMRLEYESENHGIEIIKINDTYQMCSKKDYAEFIYPLIDNRAKPSLSNAALETLAIIAYNPNITKAEVESVRGVNSDGTMYKLLEYGLIEEAGKADAENTKETEVFPSALFDCDLRYAHITNTIPQMYNTAIILYSPYSW